MKIYPAIDLINGKPVRLLQGDFSQQTNYPHDAVELACAYADAGAQHLHVVDLDGSRKGKMAQTRLIRRMAQQSGLKLQVGGGIRSPADVEILLECGVDKVVIGSLAVRDHGLATSMLELYGAEHVTMAIDVRISDGKSEIATFGWQKAEGMEPVQLIKQYPRLRHVLCTDIGRDGSLQGPNLQLYRDLVEAHPELSFQASGGVGSLQDIHDVSATGCSALIIGKALLEGRFRLEEALEAAGGC